MDQLQIWSCASRNSSLHLGPGWLPCWWVYGSLAMGTQHWATTLGSSHSQTQPSSTVQPEIQEYPNTRPRLALFCLWELHTINCLILLRVFGLLSCSGIFAEAVVSQICTLQNRGISTLSSERQSPFSKSLGPRGMCTEQEPAEETNSAHKEQRMSGLPREILTFLICKCVWHWFNHFNLHTMQVLHKTGWTNDKVHKVNNVRAQKSVFHHNASGIWAPTKQTEQDQTSLEHHHFPANPC